MVLQENALRVFLMEKLDRLGGGLGGSMGKGEGAKAQYKTQRVMLCTWLTEIFLKRIAALGRSATVVMAHTLSAFTRHPICPLSLAH